MPIDLATLKPRERFERALHELHLCWPKVTQPRASAAVNALRSAVRDGVNVKTPDENGWSLAFHAAWCPDPRAIDVLFAAGVEPKTARRDGYSLLHRAASFGRVAVIRRLVELGVPVAAKTTEGLTPLDCARASKHGAPALALLTRLTKAATQQDAARRAREDVSLDDVLRATRSLGSELRRRPLFVGFRTKQLETFARAFFVAAEGGSSEAFLRQLARQDDPALLAAGLRVVTEVTRARSTKKKVAKVGPELVHFGDLEVSKSISVGTLIVSGNLVVRGELSNFESAIVCVGGDLTAKSIVTEGPLFVRGDVRVQTVLRGVGTDASMKVGGTLTAPQVVTDHHNIEAGARARPRKPPRRRL